MRYEEWLIARARRYWKRGLPVPLDLFYEMLGAGLDVSALEGQQMQSED